MNEPFDVEISRALKEGAAKSLEGWEFTPAMRSRVMERIQAEAAAETAPASPPTQPFDFGRFVRPLAWVAAAAAAVMVVSMVGFPPMGSSKKDASRMETASAPKAAPSPAPSELAPRKAVDATADNAEPPKAEQAAPGLGSGTGAVTSAPAAPPRQAAFELTMPAVAEASTQPASTLAAPTRAAPKMTGANALASNFAGAVPNSGAVLTLTPFGVKAVDYNMATVWERPLADLGQNSLVAAAPDGRAAVANGANVLYLINDRGELDRTLNTAGAIEQLAWSRDGRVAANEGSKVVVYGAGTGKVQFSVDAGPGSEVAFAGDGLLAVYSSQTDGTRVLSLFDPKGNRLTQARPAVDGRGLVIAAADSVIVAGGQAFDRAGNAKWQLPMKTDGVAALGDQHIVAWNAQSVMVVKATDGANYVWKADWKGAGPGIKKVIPSPDGRFVVIVAPLDSGAMLWVVGADGQKILTEKLDQVPVDVGVAGDQIVLILPDAVQYRSVPH